MKKSHETCMKLLRAESEAEVLKIIENTPEMQDGENWTALDGRESNFNQTANQSSDSAKALTELMTNMVDAMLVRGCLEAGINPKDEEKAPKSMYEAARVFFGQPESGLASLPRNDPWINKFNSDYKLVVAITGSTKTKDGKPCFTFIDKGEGQEPTRFPKTFLSLSEVNKRDIPFVQGKFNMGSSGVLGYCGKHWYKLIISRRYDENSDWGWTLIRRRPDEKDKLPVSEYFFPNDEISSFITDEIIPLRNAAADEFQDVSLTSGTIVKLYNYRTSLFPSISRLREVFLENLAETVLPFRLLDCRAKPKEERSWPRPFGIDARPFLGMESQIRQKIPITEDDEGDELDIVSDAQLADLIEFDDPTLGSIRIKALLVDSKKMPKALIRSRNRFFHSVNGQVQFKKQQGLFSRMRMPYFQERMVIIIDASQLFFNAHTQIWKPDRESIRSTDEGERYIELVERHIRESEKLQQLHEQLVQEEVSRAQSTGTTDFLQNLVKDDPTLANMLQGNDPQITNIGTGEGSNHGKQIFQGKSSPSFLKCLDSNRVFEVQPRGTRIVFLTDADEEYFKRENSPGRLIIDPPDTPKENFSIGRHMIAGRLIIYINPSEDIQIGQESMFKVGLQDDGLPEPVMDTDEDGNQMTITLRAVGAKKPKKETKRKGDPKDSSANPELSVPNHKLLVKNPDAAYAQELGKYYDIEKWPDGFSEEDGGVIRGTGDNAVYCINYDNRYHLDYRRKQRDRNAKMVVTMKFIMGMLLSMIGHEKALRELIQDDESFAENEMKLRALASKGAASTVLALSEKLSAVIDIKTVKKLDDQDD